MRKISVYDTGVMTRNMGDYIIMDAVYKELNEIFPNSFFVNHPSRKELSLKDLRWMRHHEFSFVGGTNLLDSKINKKRYWGISKKETLIMKNIMLLGVGWHSYEPAPNLYTRNLLKGLSKDKYFHSVRDGYTLEKIRSCGINNVINTGCPTTWRLTKDHCSKIPTEKSERVITTITDYNKDSEKDKFMLETLQENYKEVYLWIQGLGDYEYFKQLEVNHNEFKVISPKLADYDKVLKEHNMDFVGTRLHAGIRAMQHEKRTLIIGVDNRAKEIHKDININYLNRDNIFELEQVINNSINTEVNLPLEEIKKWKEQFK